MTLLSFTPFGAGSFLRQAILFLVVFQFSILLFAADSKPMPVDSKITRMRDQKSKTVIKCAPEEKAGGPEGIKGVVAGLKRNNTLSLCEPGDYGSHTIRAANTIIEGSPDCEKPGDIRVSLEIEADNCLIRGLHCKELKVNAKIKIVDCFIEKLIVETPAKTRSEAEIFAGNSIILSSSIRGSMGYIEVIRNNQAKKDEESSTNFSDSKHEFINCFFMGKIPFSIDGALDLKFENCIISAEEAAFKKIDPPPSLTGNSRNISHLVALFDSCLVHDKSFKTLKKGDTDAAFIDNGEDYFKTRLKTSALNSAKVRSKLRALPLNYFEAASEKNLAGFLLPEDSPALAAGAGITLDKRGFLGAPPPPEKNPPPIPGGKKDDDKKPVGS